MAKSSRASSIKSNNQRLKKNVFGPIETARAERLSAKLAELAAQPKPERPEAEKNTSGKEETSSAQKDDAMDIDSTSKAPSKKQLGKKKIEKRKAKKSSIVFPKYGEKRSLRKSR